MPEDWRGDIHPENEGWGSGDSPWDQFERSRGQDGVPGIGEIIRFRQFTPCHAIPVKDPSLLVKEMFIFAEAKFQFLLSPGCWFSPSINSVGELDTDGVIDWNLLTKKPALIVGGMNGTLIFKGKPTQPSRRSKEEFFFGLDQAKDGTKLDG